MPRFEDVTCAWGRPADQRDAQMARWRRAVFQDVVAPDLARLYFLYDPIADETSETSGGRKGGPSVVVFDVNTRAFVHEIALPSLRPSVEGVPKFLFLVSVVGQHGGALLALCTEQRTAHGSKRVQLWQLQLSQDGWTLTSPPCPIFAPIPVSDDWIVCCREDCAEVVLLTGPGLTVWRLDARTASAQPVDSYQVPDAELRRFYDAFIWRGVVYLLAAHPDESLDFSQAHVLDVCGRSALRAVPARADPARGFPPARVQAGLDLHQGRIYMAGGEIVYPQGQVFKLQDLWSFDVNTFEWQQFACQLPLPLIEPRLTSLATGLIIVWGDCDIAAGCVAPPTHSHIIQLTDVGSEAPPTYGDATAPFGPSAAAAPAYPAAQQPPQPYQAAQQAAPFYPAAQQPAQAYPQAQQPTYYPPTQQGSQFYQPPPPPPNPQNKKDKCSVS